MRPTRLWLTLAALPIMAACQDLSRAVVVLPTTTIAKTGTTLVPTGGANAMSGVTVTGTVSAPAGIISAGGGNMRVLDVSQGPLANAEVFLADAGGNPIPGLASTRTDANGKFSFDHVPQDFTYVVAARARTKDGKEALLQTLAKPGSLGATADVDAASTLVTAGVVDGQGDHLGDFNPATFKTATQAAAKQLVGTDLPDFADRAALVERIGKLATTITELKGALDQLKTDFKTVKHDLDELKQQLAERPSPQPSGEKPKDDRPSTPPKDDRPSTPPKDGPSFPPLPEATLPPGARTPPPPRPTSEPSQPATTAACARLFAATDLDHDGAVSAEEWAKAGPRPAAGGSPLPEMFKRWDANGDGKLSDGEVCSGMAATPRPEEPKPTPTPTPGPTATPAATSCGDFFKRRDLNADGAITLEEWLKTAPASPNPNEPAPETSFKKLDLNADGKLTKAEICH